MSRSSIFGWSYPPGCSGPPDDYWDDSEPWMRQPRCATCGAFLPTEPTKTYTVDSFETDYGPNPPNYAESVKPIETPDFDYQPWYEWQIPIVTHVSEWHCRKCGAITTESDY